MRKRILCLLTAAASLWLCACSSGTSTTETERPTETAEPAVTTENATEIAPVSEFPAVELSRDWGTDEAFNTYVSNTVISTGSNKFIAEANNITYRAWIPVEEYGTFDYCFYFSNTVDSTRHTFRLRDRNL